MGSVIYGRPPLEIKGPSINYVARKGVCVEVLQTVTGGWRVSENMLCNHSDGYRARFDTRPKKLYASEILQFFNHGCFLMDCLNPLSVITVKVD